MSEPKSLCRVGDLCTGHDCYPPRPCITGSSTVFLNNLPIHCVGDLWDVHCCRHSGDDFHGCHKGVTIAGSSNVWVEGRLVARTGDSIDCGSKVGLSCSPDVFCG